MYTLAAIFSAIDSVRFFELSPFLYIATREWSPLNLDFDLGDLGDLTHAYSQEWSIWLKVQDSSLYILLGFRSLSVAPIQGQLGVQ